MSSNEETTETREEEVKKTSALPKNFGLVLSWVVTLLMVGGLILILLDFNPFKKEEQPVSAVEATPAENIPLPNLVASLPIDSIMRVANMDTTVPEGIRQYPVRYTVVEGDTIFGIAKSYGITPESIVYANYNLFRDDPTTILVPGWNLMIPPVSGVYYQWKEGDTLEKVADKLYANVEDIINWPGNGLDATNLDTTNLSDIMVPNGYRVISWIVPVDFAPRSGATKVIAGIGGCIPPETGPVGAGSFIWPVGATYLSGFDFSPSHLGIDIAAGVGTPVYAADSGTVVYAGWNDSGYGNLVAIDHNNGYKTIYAHLDSIGVRCGDQVYQGTFIGFSGSTGKSTGGHLHFEIRYFSQYINPWQVLP